ncbi:MAG: hypothetical protein AB2556_25005 [Candidatus Thiodiazotropha sp.]
MQVAVDVHIVDERWKPREGAQVRAAQMAGQIVDLGDVWHKIALRRVLQEKVGCHSPLGP